MNLPTLMTSATFSIPLQWTVLLALTWIAHGFIRRQDARWRLILWRSCLCFSLLLPVWHYLETPAYKVPISLDKITAPAVTTAIKAITNTSTQTTSSTTQSASETSEARPVSIAPNLPVSQRTTKPTSWGPIFLCLWIGGLVCGLFRLIRLNFQLTRIRKRSSSPPTALETLANKLQRQLQVTRQVEIKISAAVTSPFVCGLLKPTIILPQSLIDELELEELSALLDHEFAHIQQHDIRWCVAWRCLKTIGWFHPLVWAVPQTHNLACEQEADRIASGHHSQSDPYSRLLARLALRVLALPSVETKLTLNGSSQIAQRLKYLGRQSRASWNRKHSMIGFGLAGVILFLPAGCYFTESRSNQTGSIEFKNVIVEVTSTDGLPIEGATISLTGYRVSGSDRGSAYRWNPKLLSSSKDAVTDQHGYASVRYPNNGILEEKQHIEKLIFGVSHPGFSSIYHQGFAINGADNPIELKRGIRLDVSGYYGENRRPVTELVPTLNEEMIREEDWHKNDDHSLTLYRMSPGGHLIHLMGRLTSGEIVFSDPIGFTAEIGKDYKFDLELKPGIRVEGRLDDNVTRPVSNGRALISIRSKEVPAFTNYHDVAEVFEKYPHLRPWQSYRQIKEDGSFVFESVPSGGLDIIVHGDGFVSKNGGEFSQGMGSAKVRIGGIAVTQAFNLEKPTTSIEIETEATATLDITTKTRWGKTIEGVRLTVNPNILRMHGIFGIMNRSHEEPFRSPAPLPSIRYSALTDKDGAVTLKNIPVNVDRIDIFHPDFEAPRIKTKAGRNRSIPVTLAPGTTTQLNLKLPRK